MFRALIFSAAFFTATPAFCTPLIIAPAEPMVTIKGLESYGPSRLSTVLHCLSVANAEQELITDEQLETTEQCLADHT